MPARENDLLKLYLNDIRGLPRLRAGEEWQLARQIEAGCRAAEQLQAHPDIAQAGQLVQVIRCGQAARQRFIEANYHLVLKVVRRYAGAGLPLPDLIQEGNLGLIEAVDQFDYRLDCRFSTYALSRIRRTIRDAVARQAALALPGKSWAELSRVQQAARPDGDLTGEVIALAAGLPASPAAPDEPRFTRRTERH